MTAHNPKLFAVFTDRWKVYKKVIPDNLLCQSKKITYLAESENTRIRHYLARFHRKTLCYSKTTEMVEASLFIHMNNTISI